MMLNIEIQISISYEMSVFYKPLSTIFEKVRHEKTFHTKVVIMHEPFAHIPTKWRLNSIKTAYQDILWSPWKGQPVVNAFYRNNKSIEFSRHRYNQRLLSRLGIFIMRHLLAICCFTKYFKQIQPISVTFLYHRNKNRNNQ